MKKLLVASAALLSATASAVPPLPGPEAKVAEIARAVDAAKMYGGAGFAIGLDAVTAGFKEGDPTTIHWGTEHSFAASSGDLAVSIGTIRPHDPKDGAGFPFFTVWRRDGPDQPWRYIAE